MKLDQQLKDMIADNRNLSLKLSEAQEEIVRLKACLSASEEVRDANFKAKDLAFLQNSEMKELLGRFAKDSAKCQHMFESGSKHLIPDDCVFLVCQAATLLKTGRLKRDLEEESNAAVCECGHKTTSHNNGSGWCLEGRLEMCACKHFVLKPERDTCIPKPTGRALQYCSEYQKTSHDHAPSCTFAEKRVELSQNSNPPIHPLNMTDKEWNDRYWMSQP